MELPCRQRPLRPSTFTHSCRNAKYLTAKVWQRNFTHRRTLQSIHVCLHLPDTHTSYTRKQLSGPLNRKVLCTRQFAWKATYKKKKRTHMHTKKKTHKGARTQHNLLPPSIHLRPDTGVKYAYSRATHWES